MLSKETNSSFRETEKDLAYLFYFDTIQIEIKKIANDLYLSSPITPAPTEKKEEIFTYLMKANSLGENTGKASIGLDDHRKFLTLSYVMPYEENYRIFKEKIEDFINYLFAWEEEIKKFQQVLAEKIY